MAQLSRTWWGQKFIAAMEAMGDAGRLSRGRSYTRGGKIKSFDIENCQVVAQVRGTVNPYFDVHTEPLYVTTLEFTAISSRQWSTAIARISTNASLISRLMLNEIPDNLEDTFQSLGLSLLPQSKKDFSAACTCPDWGNPCKHIAGVYYRVAAELDRDPFLLFELRGLPRQRLIQELEKSPLGQALSAELQLGHQPPRPVSAYHGPLPRVSAPLPCGTSGRPSRCPSL